MQPDEAKNKIEHLRQEIERHEFLYRQKNAPEISDDDFDSLMRELRALEAQFPEFAREKSVSAKVGSDLSDAFESVAHLSPMLSLDNVFNTAELDDFDERLHKILGVSEPFKYTVEPKIDGAGVSAVYADGVLQRLLTRGDGERGDDITKNAFVIKNLPARLSGKSIPKLLEIRGEAYMTVAEFDRLSALAIESEIEKLTRKSGLLDADLSEKIAAIRKKRPFANPRNLAAGTLKLLDRDILAGRNLEVVFYSLGRTEGFELRAQSELPSKLRELGLPSVNWHRAAEGTAQAFERVCELEQVRNDFPFNTDGAVIKLDDCSLHAPAGMTSHAPRWAVAWKYRAQQAQTKLLGITIQVGRTGAITPVAELAPIYIAGTTVSRATLHNANYIAQKDIRVGDTVVIEKAGEIIPAVIRVEKSLRPASALPYAFPEVCPECGSALKVYGEKMLARCPNFSCPPQVEGRIEHFASRGCMDIRGLGGKAVKKLVEHEDIKIASPADLYTLTKDDLKKLDKFDDKSADNLLDSIEKSKTRDLWRLIFALGILEIGERFAKDLAARFGTLDALMNATVDEIKSVEGLGSRSKGQQPAVRALSVRAFFDDPHNRAMIERLRACGLNFSAQNASSGGAFAGKVFVLTGTLKSMDRNSAKELIESLGGKVASAVNSQTSFLVSGGNIEGTKARRAAELGTKVVLEDEFLAMLSAAGAPQNQPRGGAKPPREPPSKSGGDSAQMSFDF